MQENFLDENQKEFIEDIDICLIDKTQSSESHKRKYYWMRRFKPLTPYTLNTENAYLRYSFSNTTSTYNCLMFANLLFKLLFFCYFRWLICSSHFVISPDNE